MVQGDGGRPRWWTTAGRRRRPWLAWTREVLLVLLVFGVDMIVWNGDRGLRFGGELPAAVIPVTAILIYSTLLLRNRYPLTIFAVQFMYGLAGLVVPNYQPFPGLLVMVYTTSRLLPAREAAVLAISSLIPFAVDASDVSSRLSQVEEKVASLTTMLLWVVLAATFWGFGRLVQRTETESRRRAEAELERAILEQRIALAREIHDVVSHSVSAMLLQAAGAGTMVPDDQPRLRRALNDIEQTGVSAMEEMHRLLGLLIAGSDRQDSDGTPITEVRISQLPELLAHAKGLGLDADLVVEGDAQAVAPSIERTVYRVVQEAMTNSAKYAGRGALCRVHLEWGTDRLIVTIRDQRGFHPPALPAVPSSGLGLTGLAERVSLEGGEFDSGPVDGGFLVRAEIPLPGVAGERTTSAAPIGQEP